MVDTVWSRHRLLVLWVCVLLAADGAVSADASTACLAQHASVGRGHRALAGHSFLNRTGLSRLRCLNLCARHGHRCSSFNYGREQGLCQLNDAAEEEFAGDFVEDEVFSYFSYRHPTSSKWNLAWKGVAGHGVKLSDTWTSADWRPDFQVGGNWRDDCLHGAWSNGQLSIGQVKLSVWDSSGVQAELVFDGAGSDLNSWFSQERLISSPWEDLKTSTPNFFSIDGDVDIYVERRFFISSFYAGCPYDKGWLLMSGKKTSMSCDFDDETATHPYPIIIYSRTNNAVIYNDVTIEGTTTVGRADYMTIHITLNE